MNEMESSCAMPPVIILCGGKGTRIRDVSELVPKPMVPIGDQPILWHIMKSYAAFGVKQFILCTGYKKDAIVDYFANYQMRSADTTFTLGDRQNIHYHTESAEADWQITLAGTGLDSMTGYRVWRAAAYLPETAADFFLAYGDTVADINIAELYAAHKKSGKLLTITAVHPPSRFGELILQGDTVTGFEEKPPQSNGYINGGFMVVNRQFISKYLYDDESLAFEQSPMQQAVADRQMQVFKHNKFWQCMDNQREFFLLNELWATGNPPWAKFWNTHYVQ